MWVAVVVAGLNGAARDELLVAKAKTQKLADAQQRQFAVYQVRVHARTRAARRPHAMLQRQQRSAPPPRQPAPRAHPRLALAQGQQLPQYEVGGVMSTDDGPQPPATQQMSFEFPVEIPGAPPPPGPNIITVGPRPKKVPICKECVKQRKMIQKLVNQIEHDNDKAKDIQEQQDDMIESYRSVARAVFPWQPCRRLVRPAVPPTPGRVMAGRPGWRWW